MHHLHILFMHHIELVFLFFFCANLQSALGFCFCSPLSVSLFSVLSTMPRKTRAHRTSDPLPSFDSDQFPSEKNQETYETFNLRRHIWGKRRVILDEVDPEVRRNFERRV